MADTPAYISIFEEAKNMYKPGGSYEQAGMANIKDATRKSKASGKASAISSGLGGTTVMGGIDVAATRGEARDVANLKANSAGQLGSISMQMAGLGENSRQAELGREFSAGQGDQNRETQRYIADANNALQTRQLDQSEFQINQGINERTSARSAANYANTGSSWGNSGSGGGSSTSQGSYGDAPDLFNPTAFNAGGTASSATSAQSGQPAEQGGMSREAWGEKAYAGGKRFITEDSANRAYQSYRNTVKNSNALDKSGNIKQTYGAWLKANRGGTEGGDAQGARAAYNAYYQNS